MSHERLLHDWDPAVDRAIQAETDLREHETAIKTAGWMRRWHLERRTPELTSAVRDGAFEVARLARLAREEGLGSMPGQWSALSVIDGWPELSLEHTLEGLGDRLPQPWAEQTLKQMSRIRAGVARGSSEVLEQLHAELVAVVSTLPGESALRLEEHLPGRLRRIPHNLGDLERANDHVTLFVSDPMHNFSSAPGPPSGRIRLHDIVVNSRGHGLGTAVLEHLCAFADVHGCTIFGELEPGPGKPESDVLRLAGWYARHGFTQGDKAPDQWCRQVHISRAPQQSATPPVGPVERTADIWDT